MGPSIPEPWAPGVIGGAAHLVSQFPTVTTSWGTDKNVRGQIVQ